MHASVRPALSVNIPPIVTSPAARETSSALSMRMTISKVNFFYASKQVLFDINLGIATNERGDLIGGDAQVDVEEDLLAGVKEIDLGDGHAHGERRRRLSRRRAGHDGRYVHGQCWPHRSVHRLRPRNRNAPGKNRPGDDVNDQNQT